MDICITNQNETTTLVHNVPLHADSIHEEEMMVSDFVRLSWMSSTKVVLPAGAYITPFSETDAVGRPLRYLLLEPYEPTQEKESVFKYEPQFHHPLMLLSKIPFIHLTGDTRAWETATKNYEWTYVGSADVIAAEIANYVNMWGKRNAEFLKLAGSGWTAEVTGDLPSSAALSFDCYDVLSAATEAANKFGCEFHFDYVQKVFRFGTISYDRGRTEYDDPLELHVGSNVGAASVTQSKEEYYNRYVIRGGTKNLSKTSESGENVQVTERLTLPDEYAESTIDLRGNADVSESIRAGEDEPMLTGALVFDDVYPKIELFVYNARERKCYHLDSNGDKQADATTETGYKMYSKWYIRLAYKTSTQISGQTVLNTETIDGTTYYWYDYPMTEDLLIKDKTLSIVFQYNGDSERYTSPLSAREFELVWFKEQTTENEEDDVSPNGFTAQANDYRIVFTEESGVIIPTTYEGGLYPKCDTLPSKDNNKATLFNIVVDDTYKTVAQTELYNSAIKSITRLRSDLNNYTVNSYPHIFRRDDEYIHVGQKVVYDDGRDMIGGNSYMLTTHVRKIVTRLDNPYIKQITIGNEKQKGTISSMKEQIQTIILGGSSGGSGSGFTTDQIRQIMQNFGDVRYLSKIKADSAHGKITFEQGTQSDGDGTWGDWLQNVSGAAVYQDEIGNWHIEADFLTARKKLTAKELQIEKISHIGGQMLLTAANCLCDYVVEHDNFYRCYFFKKDDKGKEIANKWQTGDQAIMQSFNVTKWDADDERTATNGLRNRYYWRLVVGTSNDTTEDNADFMQDFNADFFVGKTIPDGKLPEDLTAADFHFIDLSKTDYDTNSDTPEAGDTIVQLGNRTDADRQNAILIKGAGSGSPSIDEYTGINTFALNEDNLGARIKPNDNRLVGYVNMSAGSKYDNQLLSDIFTGYNDDIARLGNDLESIDADVDNVLRSVENLSTGNENLLRNTGFTGDYTSMDVAAASSVNSETPIYSDPLQHWDNMGAHVSANIVSASGFSCILSDGYISQTTTKALNASSTYCVSFRGKGLSVTFSVGGVTRSVVLNGAITRYTEKIVITNANANTFRLEGNCEIMEIMLTEGTISNTDWLPSPLDNDKTLAYYQNLVYLANAITNASTSILGGLILTQMIRVGNYRDGEMTQETGGMSGIYATENSPFLWGGGDMNKAFYTINKYLEDPSYQATEAEVADMAKFVVTHGGRAILNDIILRGYIYAKGGVFNGTIHATDGDFTGEIHATSGEFVGEDGMFKMSLDAAERVMKVFAPSYMISDTEAGADAVQTLLMTIGGFARRIHDGKAYLTPTITSRSLDNNSDTQYVLTIDALNGLVVKDANDNLLYRIGGGFLGGSNINSFSLGSIPTSDTNLSVGDVWNDNGTLKIKQ